MIEKSKSIGLVFVAFAIGLSFFTPKTQADTTDLSKRQSGVAQRYQRLEELLLRLAEMEATENPERAALLRRAAKQSSDRFVLSKLRAASESLGNQEFQKAVDNQGGAKEELASLLKLLMSEDRSKRIREEKERYARLIKDLKRNLNNQRSTRARTENGAEIKQVEKEQKDVSDRSEELRDRLKEENDSLESEFQPKDSKESDEMKSQGEEEGDQQKPDQKEPGQKESGQKESGQKDANPKNDQSKKDQPQDGQQSEGKPQDSKPQNGKQQNSKPQDSKPQNSESKQSQSKDGESQSGEPQNKQPPQPQTPEQEVEQQLQQAIEKMKQAEEELKKANREDATEKQREAEENLRAAIDRLERILRQLREEEMQRELAKLESRLRKMSAMQTDLLKKTEALAATPKSQRDRSTDLKAGDLSFEEKKITLEADRAMLLLREEGSSVAFPEVVEGIRLDTTRVAARLGKGKIDGVTQGIQRDILAALEEMIAALQKAQRDLEQQKKQQQQGASGQSGQGEQPLVKAIAELKLLRTMETRIKSTTDRYSGLLESGESTGEDVLPLLQDLAERQSRLYQIARDLVLKRNQ